MRLTKATPIECTMKLHKKCQNKHGNSLESFKHVLLVRNTFRGKIDKSTPVYLKRGVDSN